MSSLDGSSGMQKSPEKGAEKGLEPLRADVMELLGGWEAGTREQDALRHAYLAFVEGRADSCSRHCVAGHITASTMLLDHHARHVMLTYHSRAERWLQLGGHCEVSDIRLTDTARREAHEESGLTSIDFDPIPIYLDAHPARCSIGVPTRHLDVGFVSIAPPGAQPVRLGNENEARWWPVDDLPPGSDDLVHRIDHALTRTRAKLVR